MTFKVGQKVRALVTAHNGGANYVKKGEVYTIQGFNHSYDVGHIILQHMTFPWSPRRFEPVEDAPKYVETIVEKRMKTVVEEVEITRLKPGDYGQVRIFSTGQIHLNDGLNQIVMSYPDLDDTIEALIAVRDFRVAQNK